jgi:hypothetical protein
MADHVFAANISAAPNGTTMTSKQGVPLTKGPDVRPGSRQQHARRNQASTNKKEDVEVLRWRIQSPETSHAVPVTTNAAPARTPIARTAETQVISRSEILDGLIWNDLSSQLDLRTISKAASKAVEVAVATVDHSDIRGSEPHNRDPSGATSD